MASRRFVTVDVTDTVQAWINGGTANEGLAIQAISKTGSLTASVILTSKEGALFGLPAELDIEFQPEGGVEKPVTIEQLPDSIKALLNPPPVTLQSIEQLPASLRTFLSPAITKTPSPVNPTSHWAGLSVQAQGIGNLSYQWMRNGVPISGGTSALLPGGTLQTGTYTVAIQNGFATVTSEEVQFNEPKFTDLFALVTGGTLPASSELGPLPVETFYIGRTEVTWGEWRTVRDWAVANGYTDLDGVGQGVGDNYPVSHVSWYDVVKWCNARSEKEGKMPVYKNGNSVYQTGEASDPAVDASANGYRLPSEKEWEFAARGGTQTSGYIYSGSNDLSAVGWYAENSGSAVHEVGMKQANELGVFDMSGNLWEWTGTRYSERWSSECVIRGGDAASDVDRCALADRYYGNGSWSRSYSVSSVGFRVATSGEYALEITAQPSVSLDSTTLSVEAVGAGTLTYQWMFNEGAITGGTSSQLPTRGLQSGTYTVVVSNGFASKTSEAIQYPPIGTFALVTGGTLPASSPLGAVPVETFYIGKTEVTWGEWQTVRDWAVANGYTDLADVGSGLGDNYPVTDVSWYDVVKWCNARSEKEGKMPVYKDGNAVYRTGEVSEPVMVSSANGYRLPTEAEWEFAARGGTKTQGYIYSGSNNWDDVGWYAENSGGTVHKAGIKSPNELGLFDMSGNLWEWTGDWFRTNQEQVGVIVRGGDWLGSAGPYNVGIRGDGNSGNQRSYVIGFRVVREFAESESHWRVRADIDHESILEVSPLGVRWENLGWGNRPGTLDGTGYVATSVNGFDWFAKWPNEEARSTGFSSYAEFNPGYFSNLVRVTVISSRMGSDLFEIVQQPSLANNYTLRIGLRDYWGGSDWHEFIIETTPAPTVDPNVSFASPGTGEK